ncbi:MAG TPA: ChbG/HpnK family deacetylase [Microthrixaceae bacterium]|nr:ChbG/HpnK family deacetylase [Microthrixaceae bacterium]HMT26094.1 ChbG/HpnK family deacetylase [Microthrixaceae bacterium]HMT62654.1 ChbG/HpnK family deacetylase [Microthrixaceae bacterium]
MAPLAERLGFGPTDRVVIVSADGLGVSHATTVGCYDALRVGSATSASLVMPGPWSRFAASQYRGEDVGVDLTLNAEHELLRWGPITQAPSLLDGDGGFPRTLLDVWDHADVDEVRRECRAQIERAVLWGFDVTHLTSHLATMQLRPELFDVYLDMALEFGLPMRLADASDQLAVGFPFRELAEEENVVAPDRVVGVLGGRIGESPDASLAEALAGVGEGVTEIVLYPAADDAELRSYDQQADSSVRDARELGDATAVAAAVARAGVQLVGWRALRAIMRR